MYIFKKSGLDSLERSYPTFYLGVTGSIDLIKKAYIKILQI